MTREPTHRRTWAGIAAMMLTLALLGAAADEKPTSRRSTTQDLGGSDRYLTYVSTDKPIYRPGETVYVRGVMLDAATRVPFASTAAARVEIKGRLRVRGSGDLRRGHRRQNQERQDRLRRGPDGLASPHQVR